MTALVPPCAVHDSGTLMVKLLCFHRLPSLLTNLNLGLGYGILTGSKSMVLPPTLWHCQVAVSETLSAQWREGLEPHCDLESKDFDAIWKL